MLKIGGKIDVFKSGEGDGDGDDNNASLEK